MRGNIVLTALAVLLASPVALASFPGTNGQIAYVSTADGNYDVWVMNPDGSGKVNLTANPADDLEPAWSPDGKKIAFASSRGGVWNIWIMNADGSAPADVTPQFAAARGPEWSPDGKKLVFAGQTTLSDSTDLWVIGVDGSAATRLTADTAIESQPVWSPDGTKIVYAATPGMTNDVFVINADGTGAVNLTSSPADDSGPDWSPDGTKIVWSSTQSGVSAIWVMSADGSGKTQLTNTPEGDIMPSFSPDGTKIVFASLRGWDFDVYTMNPDGSGAVRLTPPPVGAVTPPVDFLPDWQPLPPDPPSDRPPVANAGPDQTVECASAEGAEITLDGSASTDPDSTPGTTDDIVSFEWYVDFGGANPRLLGTGAVLQVTMPLGSTTVTLQVTDKAGEKSTDTMVAIVQDTRPPAIDVRLSPDVIWPPNHQMVPVHADVRAADACGATRVALVSVVSSEAADGLGDGHTSPDVQGADFGTADYDFMVRAERAGEGPGRVYTVTYAATDAAGNTATGQASVLIPRSASAERALGGLEHRVDHDRRGRR